MTPELVLLSRVAYRDREITGPRLRGLLAVLAGDLRTGISTGRLVDGLWPDEQPDNPTKAVQVLVSRARAQLGAEVIASTATGYRLALTDDQVDASAVLLSATTAARHARAGDHEAALASADAGLALCEGLQAGDAALDDPLATLRAERAETRASLARARAIALSRLGRHAEAVEALTALFAERTRDEELLLELLRSEAAVFGARDEAALAELCDRPEPLLAGVANGVACQSADRRHGPAGALPAARRMLGALERASAPWLTGLAHGRLGELCLQLERGADARAHALAALALLGEHGPRAEVTSMHLALVLTELQRGAFDEAERWLELATMENSGSSGDDEVYGLATFRHGVRAEIRLAGGEIEAGLRLWRRAADLAENADRSGYRLDAPELDPWILQAQAVTVVAHARHGRLDQVTDLVERLPGRLVTLLENPIANPPPSLLELPAAGTVVLALAMVDLDRGAHRSGARLVALAERFHYAREFQPTMSSAAARAAASVGGAAYAEAVAEFAALGNEEARAAALAELALRAGALAG